MGEKAVEIYRSFLDGNRPMTSIPYSIHLEDFFQLHLPDAPSDTQRLRFLACCQMIHRKGLDILLQACEQLRDMNWQLTLVGDGPLRHKLEREFSRSFPGERVIFKGEVPYSKRHEAFAGHHIFVFPSRWDGWGMVVAEALAAGLPVITTDQVIAAHEFIHDGRNGFMVPVNNPLALAEKMAYFLLHRGDIAQMGLAARQEVRDFRPEVGAKRLVQFLTDLLQRKNSFPPDLPPKTLHYSPTWKAFTTPDSISARIWKEVRQGSKSAVIRLGNSMRRQSRPHSHRILVYHLVLKEDRKSFDEQMKFLKDRFLICSIPEMMKHIGAREGSSAFRAAITFDDGFRVLMDDCLEILEKHNLRASFFIPTGFVELAGQREMATRFSLKTHHYNFPLEPMGPEDLQTLVKLGHEIGSHGVSHISLGSMSKQRVTRELEQSAQRIGQWTNMRPTGFAYPYGHTVSFLGHPTQWVRQAGYHYGLTQQRGPIHTSSDLFLLPREHAEGNWSVRDLRFFLMK